MNFGNSGPGSKNLLGGDYTNGFFGEVGAEKLINASSLTTLVGINVGYPINMDTDWLKFAHNNKILFVMKKPIRHSISWNDLNELSIVYGDRVIDINDIRYRVRILKGSNSNPSKWDNTKQGSYNDPPSTHGSEWNSLLYPIHKVSPSSQVTSNYKPPVFEYDENNPSFNSSVADLVYTRNSISKGETLFLENYLNEQQLYDYLASLWKPYSNEDLNVANNFGRNTWCQEKWIYNDKYRVQRGCDSIDYITIRLSDERKDSYGWRPVLEIINEE